MNDHMTTVSDAVHQLNKAIEQAMLAGWHVRIDVRSDRIRMRNEALPDKGVAVELSRRFGAP